MFEVFFGLSSGGSQHLSRDAIFSEKWQTNVRIITAHEVLEPLKQALLASHDVMISSQIRDWKLHRAFTLRDRLRMPVFHVVSEFLFLLLGVFFGVFSLLHCFCSGSEET